MSSPDTSPSQTSGLEFAKQAARIVEDNRSEDVVVLDLRGLSSVTDFFVIGTGTSDRQMRAIVDQVDEYARQLGQSRFGVSGYENGDVDPGRLCRRGGPPVRPGPEALLDLELLWGDAPRVDWKPSPGA